MLRKRVTKKCYEKAKSVTKKCYEKCYENPKECSEPRQVRGHQGTQITSIASSKDVKHGHKSSQVKSAAGYRVQADVAAGPELRGVTQAKVHSGQSICKRCDRPLDSSTVHI